MTMRTLEAAEALEKDGIKAGVLMRAGITPAGFRQVALPDAFLDAGALPTLHDRYGISTAAVISRLKGWL